MSILVAALASACGTAGASTLPSVGKTASPFRGAPSSDAPSASAAGTASASSPGSAVAPAPPGRIIFDRFDTAFGAEGPYRGSATVGPDGTHEEPFEVPVPAEGLAPAWSPDGSQLVVNVWAPPAGPARPGIVIADGTDYASLRPDGIDGDLICSDWAPDAESLLCSISGNDPALDGIYTLRIDDLHVTRLTTSPFHYTENAGGACGGGDGRARYSPDGSQIAFVRQRCGTGANPSADETAAIELMAADGSEIRELIEQGRVKSHPGGQIAWSPDGKTIAFGSQEGELYLVDVESGGVTQVALPSELGQHHAAGPDWSPDGTRLVFSLFVAALGSGDLYTVAPDGSDLRRITDEPGAEHWARWGPPESP